MRHTQPIVLESLESRQLLSYGQPVDSFGVAGRALAIFNSGNANVEELLVDKAGRILVAADNGVARFTSAGVLDTTFGAAGAGITQISGVIIRDAAIDSNGRVVLLATGASGTLLVRLTASGKTDKTFATSGAALVTSNKKYIPDSLAVGSDGKFVVAGQIKDANDANILTTRIIRLTATGQGDSSFDTDGVADLKLSPTDLLNPTPNDVIVDVAVGTGGSILVLGGGKAYSPGGYDSNTGQYIDPSYGETQLVAAQLTSVGALDTSFGSGGYARATIETGNNIDSATAGKVLADGSVALAGTDSKNRPLVARFSATGQTQRQDRATTGNAAFSIVRDISQLTDGRLILIGSGPSSFSLGHGVRTLSATGEFGPVVQTRSQNNLSTLFSGHNTVQIAASTDGDIVVAGQSNVGISNAALEKLDAGTISDMPNVFAHGTVNDIATDAKGGVHLAYFDSTPTKLMYAYRDPAGVWSKPITIDGNPRAGEYISIDVNSANRPAIAYYDGANADLKLVQFNGRRWTYSSIDTKGAVGQYPSLAFGPAGEIAIAYYTRSTGDLKFAIYQNSTWTYETIDAKGDTGRHASLAWTPNSKRPSVAYTNLAGNIKYAVRIKPGNWTLTAVTTTTGGAAYLDLAYAGNFLRGGISYYDAAAADLKLAYYDGATWKTRTLASRGAAGLYSHILGGDSSDVSAFSYNRSTDRFSVVRTAFDNPGAAATETALANSYGRYLSIDGSMANSFVAAGYDTATGSLKVIDGLLT